MASELNALYWLDLIGTFVFAISGTRAAADHKMDLFGASFLGFITAVGGGTVRDILLGIDPVGWFHDLNYLLVICLAVPFTFVFSKLTERLKKTLFLFDTLGIGAFTVLGVEKALSVGVIAPYAVIMGVVSAVVGGIIRDTFCNEIPLIFRREIYATACLLGGIALILLQDYAGLYGWSNYLITISLIIFARMVSVRYHLQLPTLR
ncbi:MAG: trimeric intracellular cation channel family protein [Cytophagales bacterium]|nr:trimeric intracellular cation channel family protein [Cytophagales bacterium]